ncbi:hypothetical protein GGI20_003044 [Coemansia sp. BCRC 34301]|nr:hypothetical protein GGI20_003044 [Coemansia sp. BCRC 34301]
MTIDGHLTNYVLAVVQQPVRVRVSAPGERDRRPIDPCPILRVKERQLNGDVVDAVEIDGKYVTIALLYDETGMNHIANFNALRVVENNTQNVDTAECEDVQVSPLFGCYQSSTVNVKDLEDNPGVFCCFPDIRVLREGRFRLQFTLFYLPSDNSHFSHSNTAVATVMSDVFTVFNARDFPGVGKTTELSKKLISQGVPIPNRTKSRIKPNSEDSSDS